MITRLTNLFSRLALLSGMALLSGCQAIQLVDHPIPVTVNYAQSTPSPLSR